MSESRSINDQLAAALDEALKPHQDWAGTWTLSKAGNALDWLQSADAVFRELSDGEVGLLDVVVLDAAEVRQRRAEGVLTAADAQLETAEELFGELNRDGNSDSETGARLWFQTQLLVIGAAVCGEVLGWSPCGHYGQLESEVVAVSSFRGPRIDDLVPSDAPEDNHPRDRGTDQRR
ncbi:MAG: hypothetical protein GY812_10910 [Actinomycetia bacterium]|nr:hypothetical protein [Actinomycetes bacterium]